MPAADTNVLVRLVVQDDPQQYAAVRTYLRKHLTVFVSLLSVFELVWVLMRRYSRTKAEVLSALRMLSEMQELDIESPDILEGTIELWEEAKSDISFADCLILATARHHHRTPLATLDKRLSKLPDTILLSATASHERS